MSLTLLVIDQRLPFRINFHRRLIPGSAKTAVSGVGSRWNGK